MELAQNGQHWSYSNLYIHRFRLEKWAQVYSNLKQILSSTCPEKRMQFKVLLLFYPLHSVSKFHFWFKNSNWRKHLQNSQLFFVPKLTIFWDINSNIWFIFSSKIKKKIFSRLCRNEIFAKNWNFNRVCPPLLEF